MTSSASRRSTTCGSTIRHPRGTPSRSTQEITAVLRVHRRRRRSLHRRSRERRSLTSASVRELDHVAPARQLVDEPAPRVHARVRRGRRGGRTRSTPTSRATCSRTSRRPASSGTADRPEVHGRLLRRGQRQLGGYAVVDTKVHEQEARRATTGTTKTTQYHGQGRRDGVELLAQGARSRCASATGTCSSPGSSRISRASSTSATSASACRRSRRSCSFDADPVPGHPRTVASRGCSTHTRRQQQLPVLAVDPSRQEPGRQRARHATSTTCATR